MTAIKIFKIKRMSSIEKIRLIPIFFIALIPVHASIENLRTVGLNLYQVQTQLSMILR